MWLPEDKRAVCSEAGQLINGGRKIRVFKTEIFSFSTLEYPRFQNLRKKETLKKNSQCQIDEFSSDLFCLLLQTHPLIYVIHLPLKSVLKYIYFFIFASSGQQTEESLVIQDFFIILFLGGWWDLKF